MTVKLRRGDRPFILFHIFHIFQVASRPPQLMFPLAVCQHVSPSLVPADNEWSFVVNFETVAIRFSTNSRQVMEEWVEVSKNKRPKEKL